MFKKNGSGYFGEVAGFKKLSTERSIVFSFKFGFPVTEIHRSDFYLQFSLPLTEEHLLFPFQRGCSGLANENTGQQGNLDFWSTMNTFLL